MVHRRVHHPSPSRALWRISCSCGWEGTVTSALPSPEAQKSLEELFVAHLRPEERQVYLLVDQRPAGADNDDVELACGNFIMPEGRPCTLVRWWEDGGWYRGAARGFALNDPTVELPIGEIRLADGRVFRAE